VILVIGQNGAWQKTLFADSIRRGEVNRMREAFGSAAGKGANVARVLVTLGCEARLLTYAGGETGRRYAEACGTDGIATTVIPIAAETRTCTTVIEPDGTVTELIEPAPEITEVESIAMRTAALEALDASSLLVISGTAVTGEQPDRYRELIDRAHSLEIPVLLDSYREHGRLALESSPEILKINAAELADLVADLAGDRIDATVRRGEECRRLRERYGIKWVIITLGRSGAEAYSSNEALASRAPEVTAINSIGSGDAFTAGVASVLDRARCIEKADLAAALQTGTALGTANCLDAKPGRVDPAQARSILDAVHTTPVA
jgi:tagatose 6-phosphate kinase